MVAHLNRKFKILNSNLAGLFGLQTRHTKLFEQTRKGSQFLNITTSALYNLVLTIAMLPMAAKENIRYWDHETPAGMFQLLRGGLAFDRNVNLLGFDVS